MASAISLLKGALNQVTEWVSITQTHHNFSPDTDPLREFVNGAEGLKAPALLMSAPNGIAAVTPETTLLAVAARIYGFRRRERFIFTGQGF